MLRGIWLCAEAIPLEINNAAAANMAEYFLMSSFLLLLLLVLQTNAGRRQAFRQFVAAHAKFPNPNWDVYA